MSKSSKNSKSILNLTIFQRTEEWMKNKELKNNQLKDSLNNTRNQECTFKPQLVRYNKLESKTINISEKK